MQIKLQYDANGGTEWLRYLHLPELPTKGQVLDVGGGMMLEVMEVTATPTSLYQGGVAIVRPLSEAA